MTDIMFCPQCGNQNDRGVSFRRKCGGEFANSSPASVADILKKSISGELVAAPSVTERTTRDLG